jgi:hypothetical protein
MGFNLLMNVRPGTFSLMFFFTLTSEMFVQFAKPPMEWVAELPRRTWLTPVHRADSPIATALNNLHRLHLHYTINTLFHPLLVTRRNPTAVL